MKICSLYGAGYYYMPGTDICLKLGGFVRYQLNVGAGNNISAGPQHGTSGYHTRFTDNEVAQRVRALISVDTRQQTAYGTLRTYMILGYNHDVPTSGAATLYVNRGFIQIAGFTFGKATSYFDIFPNASFAYNAGNNWSGDSGDGGVIGMWYTAQFGNGFSGSIGIEQARRLGSVYTHGATGAALGPVGVVGANPAANNFGATGSTLPDLVGNLRLDQSWGTWIVAAALHDVSGGYYGPTLATAGEAFGNPGRDIGWAVTTGFILNLPMIAPGDRFSAQVVYSQGATNYHAATRSGAQPTYYSGNSYSFGLWSDAVWAGNTGLNAFELTTAWSIAAAFEHRWTPNLKTSWYGSYIDVSYNGASSALLCTSGGAFTGAALVGGAPALGAIPLACDPDWTSWTAGSRTEWEPVKGLTFGVDVIYQQINSSNPGIVSATGVGTGVIAPGLGKQTMNYVIDDQGVWSGSFRVQRNFLP